MTEVPDDAVPPLEFTPRSVHLEDLETGAEVWSGDVTSAGISGPVEFEPRTLIRWDERGNAIAVCIMKRRG